MIGRFLFVAAATLLVSTGGAAAPAKPRASIVLVHGLGMDAASWRPLVAVLKAKGYRVTAVQEPLTGFANDVAATKRAIAAQPGPVVLVGHSYGGMVITTAGNDPKVRALVYVAALQPDRGETMASLNAQLPSAFPADGTTAGPPNFVTVKPQTWREYVGEDLPPQVAADFAARQRPTSTDVYAAPTLDPAWRHKPTFGIVSTKDRALSPELERWMYRRSGSTTTELDTGHMTYLVEPRAVADVIVAAAQSIE